MQAVLCACVCACFYNSLGLYLSGIDKSLEVYLKIAMVIHCNSTWHSSNFNGHVEEKKLISTKTFYFCMKQHFI